MSHSPPQIFNVCLLDRGCAPAGQIRISVLRLRRGIDGAECLVQISPKFGYVYRFDLLLGSQTRLPANNCSLFGGYPDCVHGIPQFKQMLRLDRSHSLLDLVIGPDDCRSQIEIAERRRAAVVVESAEPCKGTS
jgi:hypothetical protein